MVQIQPPQPIHRTLYVVEITIYSVFSYLRKIGDIILSVVCPLFRIFVTFLINAVRNTCHCSCLSLLKRMTVNIQSCVCIVMTKTSLNRFNVHAIADKYRSIKVTKWVNIAVTDIVLFTEIFKKSARNSYTHWRTVSFGEQPVTLYPLVAERNFVIILKFFCIQAVDLQVHGEFSAYGYCP